MRKTLILEFPSTIPCFISSEALAKIN